MQLATKPKSFKLAEFNFFAIPLVAIAGLSTIGVFAINQDIDPNASASNSAPINTTISYDDEYITISSSSSIELGTETVTSEASYTYTTDNVTVSTNVATGYDLYISSGNNESAALTTSSSYTTIAPTSGTGGDSGTPAALDDNSYGYAVPSEQIGNTGFDADYSNPNGGTSKWAGVPAGSSDRIRTTSTAVDDGETTNVYYGASVSNALAPGTYTGRVIYSAVVTPTSGARAMSVSPRSGIVDTELTILSGPTTISTAAELDTNEVEVYFRQGNVTKGTCVVTNVDVSDGYVKTTCTVPGGLSKGVYDLAIIIPRFGFKDTLSSGYTSNSGAPYRMQDITSSICSNYNTFDATSSTAIASTTYTVVDTRDNNDYYIRKLADGNCWMVQNLRLTATTLSGAGHSTVLKSSDYDTNIATGNFTMPSNNTWSGDYGDITINGAVGAEKAPTSKGGGAPGVSAATTERGAYYTWCTATASCSSAAGTSVKATDSICPKGWSLPDSDGSSNSSDQFYKLYSNYSNYSSFAKAFHYSNSSYYLAGYWWAYANQQFIDGIGVNGSWWSSRTAPNAAQQAFIIRDSDSNASVTNGARFIGFSVRCVFVGS